MKISQKIFSYIQIFFILFIVFIHSIIYAQQDFPVKYLDSITEDENNDRLLFPSLVFIEPIRDEIYVISQNRIILYTSDFFPVFTLTKKDGIENPYGLTVDDRGNLYIAQGATQHYPKHRISVFNARLKWERDIYLEDFEGSDLFIPNNLAIDSNGNIYVTGSYFPGVIVINNQGKILDIMIVEEDSEKIKLDYATIDKTGNIYLVSEEKGHIYVYDKHRKFLYRFGDKGGCAGKLSRPQAVSIDEQTGMKYVVDYMRHTVLAYDANGKYLFEFGGLGWGEGWFQYPTNIAVDNKGRIFVADTYNDRIQVFKPEG